MERPEPDDGRLEPKRLTTPRAAGVAGLVFAVCFATAVLISRISPDLSGSALAASLVGPLRTAESIVALFLVPFAGIAFLWFVGVIRDRIGVHEDRLFATIFLGSGILFVAMMFVSAATIGAMVATNALKPEVADFGRALGRTMLFVYGARTAGVFTLVTSTIVYRTEALPKWVAYIGFALGLALLLSIRWFDLIILLFPLWVALLSVVVLMAAPQLSRPGAGS